MKPLPYNPDSVIVSKEMCDHNGHMNVNYYYQLFDSTYTSFYIEELGFDEAYMEKGFSTFTLEDSIRYLKEFRLNDVVYPSFQLYKANKKTMDDKNIYNKILYFSWINNENNTTPRQATIAPREKERKSEIKMRERNIKWTLLKLVLK